ncbi:MAG: Coenzyme F420 hydrogenase/dehydrogenase, beta subunit C-terminal domain [Thermodesulfobacteriota bacterium]|nr:Coenzyme F420 hydrogenase/dehydrogenase, beta subunit C-terminal domain [Thermodesulfobacteriota bacterium]
MKSTKLEEIVEENNCIGCGFCAVVCPQNAIEMVYDKTRDSFKPEVAPSADCNCIIDCLCYDFCPGKNLDLHDLIMNKYGSLPENYLTGHYTDLKIGHSTNSEIREASSSGGLVPAILAYLFDSNQIDCAYCVVPSKESPYKTSGKIIYSTDELSSIHGSVYHPVNFGKELKTLFSSKNRFAFVGVPCQIEALEKYKIINPGITDYLVLSIGVFCGGYNKFQAFEYYLKEFAIKWKDVKSISFRHGKWPGQIRVEFSNKENVSVIPRTRGNTRSGILRYASSVDGFYMLKRCRLCPDPLNDLADVALGDPHLPKFKQKSDHGNSIIVSRNKKAKKIIDDLLGSGALFVEEAIPNDVILSQGHTLKNRKYLKAYLSINRFLGGKNPVFILDERAYHPYLSNYLFAFRDLTKIYFLPPQYFQSFYKLFQIFDYLILSLLKPKKLLLRLSMVIFKYK